MHGAAPALAQELAAQWGLATVQNGLDPEKPDGVRGVRDRQSRGAAGRGRCGPALRAQLGVQRGDRPLQGGPRVRQLPGEPGALRGRRLCAAGGYRQVGAPRRSQLAQGHLQRVHVVEEPGRDACNGRAGFWRQVAAEFWADGPGLPAVLATSPIGGRH